MGLTILLLAGMFILVVVELVKIQNAMYRETEGKRPPEYELLKNRGIININMSNDEIVVPDDVHIKNSTQKSTQNIDCRKYANPSSFEKNVEKIVVGNGYKTNTYQTTKINEKINDVIEKYEEIIYDDINDDPIQEKQSFFSKLFGSKIDRL